MGSLLAAALVILLGSEIRCLRLVSLHIPKTVIAGSPAWLNCTYALETDVLYAVKWYKNETEFYRYVPRDNPPAQIYSLPGIYIDLRKSYEGHVFLNETDMNSEGNYRCEASAEAPSFQTIMGEKKMQVHVIPQKGPAIEGIQPKYDVGDFVNVTCKSSPSRPAAKIHWFINNQEPLHHALVPYLENENIRGLISSKMGLYFELMDQHFVQNAITLRCSAAILNNYTLSSEEIVIGGSFSLSSPYPRIGSNSGGPVITGGYPVYRINDVVDVNCSSATTKTPVLLHWFINEQPAPARHLVRYRVQMDRQNEMIAVLRLRFITKHKHFQDGEMHLKCTSTLSDVKNMSTRENVFGNHHKNSKLHASEDEVIGNSAQLLRSQLLYHFLFVFTTAKLLVKPF
ncbi:uncharacterized protein LOC106473310 isoform X2 [Limulus polyphemus]|uniref:Uncharacterized protein LOC106473310 isoform X2 n=1 Tax=Limulus polyphemus TaxID=6850 RepID=A0ABM1BVG1_LIMPO|nr:uncharacterized protein LOC106473310 isoform X2 [Limulus polyphemus]